MADPILVTDLTTGKVDGIGVFDKLMAATKPHIKAEYDSGRIKGAEYSQVYLGAVQSAMSNSIEFLLRQASTQSQNALLDQQLLTETQNTALATAQVVLSTADATQRAAQTAGIAAEKLLTDQRTLTEVQNTLVATAQECKLRNEFMVLDQQITKVQNEALLLAQKKTTELAQVSSANVASTSVVGAQVALYAAQKDGFTRDAEQKAAKLYFDTWNVRRTTVNTVAPTTQNELTDTDIGLVAAKLKAGIGI